MIISRLLFSGTSITFILPLNHRTFLYIRPNVKKKTKRPLLELLNQDTTAFITCTITYLCGSTQDAGILPWFHYDQVPEANLSLSLLLLPNTCIHAFIHLALPLLVCYSCCIIGPNIFTYEESCFILDFHSICPKYE